MIRIRFEVGLGSFKAIYAYHSHCVIYGINFLALDHHQMYFTILLINECHNFLLEVLGRGIVQFLFDVDQSNFMAIDLEGEVEYI